MMERKGGKTGSLLLVLTLGVFSIINTEMGVVGILPMVSVRYGVEISAAGLLVSLFALAVAVSGPILPLLFSRFRRKAVMMAVKLLSENMDLLHGKWNKILEENQLLEKHYSVLLAELINKECWEYDSFEMCQVLDSILISEDGQITVRFLEGTEVDL